MPQNRAAMKNSIDINTINSTKYFSNLLGFGTSVITPKIHVKQMNHKTRKPIPDNNHPNIF